MAGATTRVPSACGTRTTSDWQVPEIPSVRAGGLEAVQADVAGVVREGEWRDHQVARGDSGDQVAGLLQDGREPCTDDEVRVEHEAETKRMWLPKGKRTKLYVDRKKASRSFIGALSLTTKK